MLSRRSRIRPPAGGETPPLEKDMSEKRATSHFNISGHANGHDADIGGNVFPMPTVVKGTSIDPMRGVSQELLSIKNGLGFIDTFIVDRKINREAKRVVADAYLQLIEAKRQELITKITLGLDESKKRALIESLRLSDEIDKEIADLSAQFSNTMFDGALATNFAAARAEFKKLDEIEVAFKAAELTEPRYRQLKEATSEAADHVIALTKDTVARIIQTHIGKVHIALELFKERLLGRGF